MKIEEDILYTIMPKYDPLWCCESATVEKIFFCNMAYEYKRKTV